MSDLAKTEQKAVATPMDREPRLGLENFNSDTVAINYLRIAQTNTAQAQKADKDSYIQGLDAGMFFATTGQVYGESVEVIPVFFFDYIAKTGESKKPLVDKLARSDLMNLVAEGKVKRATVNGKARGHYIDEEGHEYHDTRAYCVIIAGHVGDGLLMFTLSGSGIRHSKKWNELIQRQGGNIFDYSYNISLAYNTNEMGKWYTIGKEANTLISVGNPTPEDFKPILRKLYQEARVNGEIFVRDVAAGEFTDDIPF